MTLKISRQLAQERQTTGLDTSFEGISAAMRSLTATEVPREIGSDLPPQVAAALDGQERQAVLDKVAQLPPSVVQDFRDNIQCLPPERQGHSFYQQVMSAEVPPYMQTSLPL